MTDTIKITASCTLGDHELTDIPCVNPGEWWGQVYLIESASGYSVRYYAVEAGSEQDAFDEFCDSEEYGSRIHDDEAIEKEKNGTLTEEEDQDLCRLGNAGTPCNLDDAWIHSAKPGCRSPGFKGLRYHHTALDEINPGKGINPKNYSAWLDWYERQQEKGK